MLKSLKSITDAVVPIETLRSVKVVTNPTRGDIVAGDEPKNAKGSSVIGAFVHPNFHNDHTRAAW